MSIILDRDRAGVLQPRTGVRVQLGSNSANTSVSYTENLGHSLATTYVVVCLSPCVRFSQSGDMRLFKSKFKGNSHNPEQNL